MERPYNETNVNKRNETNECRQVKQGRGMKRETGLETINSKR